MLLCIHVIPTDYIEHICDDLLPSPQVADDLNPLRVLQLFQAVSDLDCQLLDLRGRPEDLVMTVLPVPPLSIRPSVEMDAGAGSNEEDITVIVKARLVRLSANAAVHARSHDTRIQMLDCTAI